MLPLLTSQKVAIPATLFLALSPGMLLKTNGSNISFKNVSTDRMSFIFLCCVCFFVDSVSDISMVLVLTCQYLLFSSTLFLALSPGMLLTIPPGEVMSGKTSRPAILTHAVVFAVVFALLRKQFPQFY